MLTCYVICRMMSHRSQSIDVLILTAFLLLIYNPQWLFDVGFQMSFMAMTGILLLNKPLSTLLAPHSTLLYPLSSLLSILTVSFTASLGVMPLIAFYFGRVSLYGLLANLIVSPCATLIIFLSFLIQICPKFLLEELGACLSFIVTFMNSAVGWIATIPGASVEGISITASQTILIYVIIIALIMIIVRVKQSFRHRLHS